MLIHYQCHHLRTQRAVVLMEALRTIYVLIRPTSSHSCDLFGCALHHLALF